MGKTVMTVALMLANHPSSVLLDEKENEAVKAEEGAAHGHEEERKEGLHEEADDEVELLDVAGAAAPRSAAAAAGAAAASASSSSLFDFSSSRARHRRKYMLRDGI